MGMLIHHTWLAEQKEKAEKKPVAEKVEEPTEETKEPETAKKGGRRKVK